MQGQKGSAQMAQMRIRACRVEWRGFDCHTHFVGETGEEYEAVMDLEVMDDFARQLKRSLFAMDAELTRLAESGPPEFAEPLGGTILVH